MPPFLTFEVIGFASEYVQVIDFEKEMQTIDQIRDYIEIKKQLIIYD
jgi:hypothetical protein